MLSASLGTIKSGSKSCFSPRPSQPGQAPCGALKLNRRGSISAMVKPETGQANFSEKTMRPSGAWVARTLRSWASSSALATPVRAEEVSAPGDSGAEVLGPSTSSLGIVKTARASATLADEPPPLDGEG